MWPFFLPQNPFNKKIKKTFPLIYLSISDPHPLSLLYLYSSQPISVSVFSGWLISFLWLVCVSSLTACFFWLSSASHSSCTSLLPTSHGKFTLFPCLLTDPCVSLSNLLVTDWPCLSNCSLVDLLYYGEAKIPISGSLYGHTHMHMHTHSQPTTIYMHIPACTHMLSHRDKPVYSVTSQLEFHFFARHKEKHFVEDCLKREK